MEQSRVYFVRVRGPLACFTRPEFNVERVSYEVMTPSAARAILRAIFWSPPIRWNIHRIHVLAPIKLDTMIALNEVDCKMPRKVAELALNGRSTAMVADDPRVRAQRRSLVLRNVDYVIEASFDVSPGNKPDDGLPKFASMFERRLEGGQWHRAPWLGIRDYEAAISPVHLEDGVMIDGFSGERLQYDPGLVEKGVVDLGRMFFGFADKDRAIPLFFDAALDRGRLVEKGQDRLRSVEAE